LADTENPAACRVFCWWHKACDNLCVACDIPARIPEQCGFSTIMSLSGEGNIMDKEDIIQSTRPNIIGVALNNTAPLLMASMMLMIIAMIVTAASGFG
jgi:hypothetical protein